MSILGMGWAEATWQLPMATGLLLQAAYLERNGKPQDWGGAERSIAILEKLEALRGER